MLSVFGFGGVYPFVDSEGRGGHDGCWLLRFIKLVGEFVFREYFAFYEIFYPQNGFICFFLSDLDFVVEISVAFGNAGRAIVGGNRSCASEQLFAKDFGLGCCGKLFPHADDAQPEIFCALPQISVLSIVNHFFIRINH